MLKVMIVDDEPYILQGLQLLIDWNHEGFEIDALMSNGKEALDYLADHKIDLIISDIKMPVMNGLEATKAIRRLDSEYARSVPIIAMSADAFSENVTECLQAGMNGHIAKPIDLKLVLNEIRKINKK